MGVAPPLGSHSRRVPSVSSVAGSPSFWRSHALPSGPVEPEACGVQVTDSILEVLFRLKRIALKSLALVRAKRTMTPEMTPESIKVSSVLSSQLLVVRPLASTQVQRSDHPISAHAAPVCSKGALRMWRIEPVVVADGVVVHSGSVEGAPSMSRHPWAAVFPVTKNAWPSRCTRCC